MESVYYSNTTMWVILVDILMGLGTLWLFWQAKASLLAKSILAVTLIIIISCMHWLFGGQRFPVDLDGSVFFGIVLVWAGAVVALLQWQARAVMHNLNQVHLQLVQGLRVFIGGGFLMEGVLGVIPQAFSIVDGFFHISSGFFALLAAIAVLKRYRKARTLLWVANLIGLLDILVIVSSICFWVWPDLGPNHNMHYVVFGVGPLLLWIHLNSITKLLKS